MKSRTLLQFWFVIVSIPLLTAWARATLQISEYEFQEITALADRVIVASGDQKTLVVAVGRSPTVIAAEIERRGGAPVAWLPLSAFRFHPDGAPEDKRLHAPHNVEEYFRELTADERLRLFDHFEKYLAAHSAFRTAGRLMFLDYSLTADSMVSVSYYTAQWLQSRRNKKRLSGIALTQPERLEQVSKRVPRFSGDLTVIPIPAPSILADRLQESFYEPHSPNPYFSLRTGLEHEIKNKNETADPALVEELRQALETAATVHKASVRWAWSPTVMPRLVSSIAIVSLIDRRLLSDSTLYIRLTEPSILYLLNSVNIEAPLSGGMGIFAVHPGSQLHELILMKELFSYNLLLEEKDIDAQIELFSKRTDPEAKTICYVLNTAKSKAKVATYTVNGDMELLPWDGPQIQTSVSRVSGVEIVDCGSNLFQ